MLIKKYSIAIIFFFTLVFGQVFAQTTESKKQPPHFLVISCSLSPSSHSSLLAQQAVKILKTQGQEVDFIDLRKYDLPFSNGHEGSAYDHPQVKEIHDRINTADGILIAAPIYNNSVAAVAKNLIELTTHPHKSILSGSAWKNKVVGFIGASGGKASTYAFFPFLNILTLEAKVVCVPSFVMASTEDFDDKNQFSAETAQRIENVVKDLIRITTALKE